MGREKLAYIIEERNAFLCMEGNSQGSKVEQIGEDRSSVSLSSFTEGTFGNVHWNGGIQCIGGYLFLYLLFRYQWIREFEGGRVHCSTLEGYWN